MEVYGIYLITKMFKIFSKSTQTKKFKKRKFVRLHKT